MDKTGAVETVDRISGILTDSDLDSVHRTDSPEPEGPCLVRKPTTDEGRKRLERSDFSAKYPDRKYPSISSAASTTQPTEAVPSQERCMRAINVLKELGQDQADQEFPVADSPEFAAVLSRMNPIKMSHREELEFPEVVEQGEEVIIRFLKIRNMILQMWHLNPQVELTATRVVERFSSMPGHEDDGLLAKKVFWVLNRICAVNYGIFEPDIAAADSFKHKVIKKSIIIIGAGIAGLAAGRKLKEFGFDVLVLEGRRRLGGRIHTWQGTGESAGRLAEQGAMIITGLVGNPISTIMKQQLGIQLVRVGGRCPLFNSKGDPVPKAIDEVLEVEFNTVLSAASKSGRSIASNENGRPRSLGEALTLLLKKEELTCIRRGREFLENKVDLMKMLTLLRKECKSLREKLEDDKVQYQKATNALAVLENNDTRFMYRLTQTRMLSAVDQLKDMQEKIGQLTEKLNEMMKKQPPLEYLDAEGRGIFAWHEANLEFANANHLDCLSLENWDQDDEYELPGGHFSVPEGMCKLTDALASGLEIDYEQCACTIIMNSSSGNVSVHSFQDCQKIGFSCDAVLCTVPLGILKKSIRSQEQNDPPGFLKGTIHFYPPLPEDKIVAISSMGYGVLNKVILTYKTRFWEVKRALFGYINEEIQRRGEFFLYWSLYDHPTLVVLLAGEAAIALEGCANEAVVEACQNKLKLIFGDIESPVDSVVTRWRRDVWSEGSYSSVAPGGSGADYDTLSMPLPDTEKPTVFFAGEHTIRNYPATVHGALLSGLREATRIADLFLELDGTRRESTAAGNTG